MASEKEYLRQKKYRDSHYEQIKAKHDEWIESHRDEWNAYMREYRENQRMHLHDWNRYLRKNKNAVD